MSKLSRRQFIQAGAYTAGAVALTGTTVGVTRRLMTPKPAEGNPFAYKTAHIAETDPKWLHYEEVTRFPCPRSDARRISNGPNDRLYLAAGNYITILDRQGTLLNEVALTDTARCVAVAKDGMIYAGLRSQIEVFDAKGGRQATWEPAAQRAWFTGLAVADNEVFAADAGNRIVLRYDRSGKLLCQIGSRDSARNIPGFSVPSPFFDLELGSDGLLRVANPGRHRVHVFTLNGDLEFSFGHTSAALEGFCGCCNPVSLTLLSDGRYLTCEKGLPRVKIYRADGGLESVVAGAESFTENALACEDADCRKGGLDAAVDSQGRIYILDLVLNEVRVMQRKAHVA